MCDVNIAEVKSEYQISDFSYNQIINKIITELYLNRNTIKDKAFYTYLIKVINRECTDKNIDPKFFYNRFTECKESDFSRKVVQLETFLILESEKISQQDDSILKSIIQRCVEKNIALNFLSAIKIVQKWFTCLSIEQQQVYWYKLWKYYLMQKI